MEHKFFDPLGDCTREVFETMLYIQVIQQPMVKDNTDITGIELTAMISFAGEISGLIALHCSRAFMKMCVQAASGEESEPSLDEMRDMAGEVANMIAGSMKRRLSTMIELFDIALPSIISSSGHSLRFQRLKRQVSPAAGPL